MKTGADMQLVVPITIPLKGKRVTLKVLIDTGAQTNLVRIGVLPTNLFHKSSKPLRLMTANNSLMAGGVREVRLDMIFFVGQQKSRLRAKFYEADIKVDAIIGYPWLKEHGIVVCAREGCLGVPDIHNIIRYMSSNVPVEVRPVYECESEDACPDDKTSLRGDPEFEAEEITLEITPLPSGSVGGCAPIFNKQTVNGVVEWSTTLSTGIPLNFKQSSEDTGVHETHLCEDPAESEIVLATQIWQQCLVPLEVQSVDAVSSNIVTQWFFVEQLELPKHQVQWRHQEAVIMLFPLQVKRQKI
jgi:hypothetical protein